MNMNVVDPALFVARAEIYARRAGIALSTLSQRIFLDRNAIDRAREGRMTYARLARANEVLDELERRIKAEAE